MNKLILAASAALSLTAAGGTGAAQAATPLVVGVDHPGDAVLRDVQYVYLGHDWCWYNGAWRGPGFYWCGYAWRRGFGWGGPAGWRGWSYGPHYWRGGAWIGPRGYSQPEWRGWHDGGRGGAGHGGGGHGGGGHGGGGGHHR
jgi:hypothetical protein